MREFDALPPELRCWMAGAVLPWSAQSCLKIWRNAANEDEALRRLKAAEQRLLHRERRIS